MSRYILVSLFLLLGLPGKALSQPTPTEILERIDANMTIETSKMRAQMIVEYNDGDTRTMEFESWAEGRDQSFLEFVSPARDAGSRFLRLDDKMWIFLPRAGKSVRIQGHMLRQGLMGSDFSYGDASENPSMVDDYEAVVEKEEVLNDRSTFVLYLTAKKKNLAYTYRRIWVDAERWVPLKEERFARSGKLLKTSWLSDVRQVNGRWYPYRVELDNALQKDTRSTMQILEVAINVEVPGEVFTLRHLESSF